MIFRPSIAIILNSSKIWVTFLHFSVFSAMFAEKKFSRELNFVDFIDMAPILNNEILQIGPDLVSLSNLR